MTTALLALCFVCNVIQLWVWIRNREMMEYMERRHKTDVSIIFALRTRVETLLREDRAFLEESNHKLSNDDVQAWQDAVDKSFKDGTCG